MTTQNYSKSFSAAFDHLIEIEGGYVNDPDDRGGETRYGISKRAHPEVDIVNLTLEGAKEIYWSDYWCANQCDRLPEPLAIALFDGVVNHRVRSARKMMQVALGVTSDGIIGQQTITTSHNTDCKSVLARYFTERAFLYHQIIVGNSSQSRFAKGWFKRLFKVQQFILDECWPWNL